VDFRTDRSPAILTAAQIQECDATEFPQFRPVEFVAADEIQLHACGRKRRRQTMRIVSILSTRQQRDSNPVPGPCLIGGSSGCFVEPPGGSETKREQRLTHLHAEVLRHRAETADLHQVGRQLIALEPPKSARVGSGGSRRPPKESVVFAPDTTTSG
jgi:hypothetical protein